MRKTLLFIIIGFMVCLCGHSSSAQEVLQWKDVVVKTIELQPDLKGAALKVDEARYDEKTSKSSLLPQVSASSSYRRSKTSSSDWSDSYNEGLSASLLVFDGFKTPYALKAARKKIDEQQLGYEAVSSDVLFDIRTAFIELMDSQESLKLTESIRDRKRQNLELVQLRYEGGKEHKGSFLTAEAELAEAEFDLREAQRGLVLSRRKLLIAMGTEKMQDVTVSGEFNLSESYNEKPMLNQLLVDVPFLKQLAVSREIAMANQKSTQGALWPSISATSSLGRSGDHFLGDGDTRSASLGLSISMPLFEGGRNIANIQKSHVSFLRSQATEQSGRQQVLLSLEENWKKLIDAIETVDVRKKFLQATEERAKIANAQYGNGLIGFDDWIIIENNLVSAQKSFLSVRAGMMSAEAGWIHSLGGALNDEIY